MDKNKQPGISFDNIILVKENFWRDYDVPEDSKLDFQIGTGWDIKDNSYYVELSSTITLISADKEALKLENTFVGVFSVIKGSENMNIEDYIRNNSAALMFPYMREHIATITQKSGIKPILLPPVNILALIQQN
ncbi:protein-export chaperone SecB [Clostridium magnum]|uniref:Protein-export protein SecB n=1 Tax=Clostridium magnum DSM 2767 TaxID=1121326 RepID=A0A162UQW7_9CLOT|nr:protein-export chaperone SecB [Clostridium magnum]KZL94194.1 protein-export protein SecB [Clostridium magnum DSM 2767]SHH93136.1 preprotein translocase subunit SecB [Clostridium magnum DSM 2767]